MLPGFHSGYAPLFLFFLFGDSGPTFDLLEFSGVFGPLGKQRQHSTKEYQKHRGT